MDDAPDLPPIPSTTPSAPRAQGRPPSDPQARAANDARYQAVTSLESVLPNVAKEARFAIFPVRQGRFKASHTPIARILHSEWKECDLQDIPTLQAYLRDKFGEGTYWIEAQDQHNRQIPKIPHWIQPTENDMSYEDEDTPPRGRLLRRRGRPEEDDFDDGEDLRERRANIGDWLQQTMAQGQEQQAAAARSGETLLQTLMLQEKQSAEERRRQEERRDEERREERRLAEERRQAEERRREESEERRREEAKREEDRRRDEERRRDTERREDLFRQMEAQNKRMELILGGLTAALPVVSKLFERKEDPMQTALLASLTKDRQTDPTQVMLLKHILDKSQSNDSLTTMVQSMGEMSKMSSSMMAEQMKSMFLTMNQFQQEAMKKVMAMALANPNIDEEEKGTFQQIMEAISGASGLIKDLTGGQQAPPQQQFLPVHPQQQQQFVQAQQQVPVQQQQGMTVEGHAPVMGTLETEPPMPTGVQAVGACLMTIQQKAYPDQTTYQGIVGLMIDNMPPELKQAIVEGNESRIVGMCMQTFQASAELKAWIMQPGVFDWIRQYLNDLVPALKQVMSEEEGGEQPEDESEEVPEEESEEPEDVPEDDPDAP